MWPEVDLPLLISERRHTDGAIMVDDCERIGAAFNIDHHVGHLTPASYRNGRTSTERVINAIRAGLEPSQFRSIIIHHFDADGALAIWALRNSRCALDHVDQLVAAAEYGDFFETEVRDEGNLGLNLSVQIQEGAYVENRKNFSDLLCRARYIRKLYDFSFEIIASNLSRPKSGFTLDQSVARPGFHESASMTDALLVSGTVPVFRMPRLAHLSSVLKLTKAAVVITQEERSSDACYYSVLLRPKFGWGYSEDAVGPIPLRSLDGLRDALDRLIIPGRRSPLRWTEQNFDGTAWRLDSVGVVASLRADVLSRVVSAWLSERRATDWQ